MPYWSLYLRSINFDAEQIGIISAIVVGTKIFATYLWGWVSDHSGQRIRVIQITSLCAVITFATVLLVRDFWLLTAVMFLFAAFWSASLPQIDALTMSVLGTSCNDYTLVRLWGSIGFVVVNCLAIIFSSLDISYVPLLLVISLLLVWLLTLLIPAQPLPTDEQPLADSSLGDCIRQPHTIALLCACFLMLASHGPYYIFYSIYLEDYGYSRAIIGSMWVLGVIAEIVLFLLMRRLITAFGLRRLFIFSFFAAGVRWFLIACFADNLLLLIIGQLLHAATFGICHAVAIQYIHRYFTGRLQGRGQGLYSSVSFGAGLAAGSLLSGYGWGYLGATACFAIASATAFVAMLIAWVFIQDS